MFIEEISLHKLQELNRNGVFASKDWLSIYDANKLMVLGVFNKNKELIGSFLLYKYKRAKLFSQIAPPPFMQHNALWVENRSSNFAQKNTFNKKIMSCLSEFLNAQKYASKTLIFSSEYNDLQPLIWSGFSTEVKYTYQINLNLTEEELMANMSTQRRKNIKKAMQDGLVVKQEHGEDFRDLIKNTFVSQNMQVDCHVLNKILNEFSSSKNALSLTTYNRDGHPLAANLCVFDDNKAYYLLGGYNKATKHEGAGALAMWEAIKIAKQKGIPTFDFEGSMVPKIEKYFRGFGGELIPYYSVNKSSSLFRLFLKIKNIIK